MQDTSLVTFEDAAKRIRSGAALSIAGEEQLLRELPRGKWIGGTIPYFMARNGGCKTKSRLMVAELTQCESVAFKHYPVESLGELMRDAPENGWSLIIMPYGGKAHEQFAVNCRDDAQAFLKPVVGWIAGIDLDLLGKITPKVVFGPTGEVLSDGAVAAHGTLADGKLALIEVINIFEPDRLDCVRFPSVGFKANQCTVNGKPTTVAAFLKERGNVDGKLPLVGDFSGTYGNAAIQAVNTDTGEVGFYAPVFPDVDYYLAKPVANYVTEFHKHIAPVENEDVLFSCNCAVNYLYGELEGKKLGRIEGPVTFGEIGYQLLSQTMVAMRIC